MPLAPPPEPPATPANLFVGDVCGPTSFCGEPSLPVAPAPPPADVIVEKTEFPPFVPLPQALG